MDDCVFCKIVKGEIPSYKIYEDDNYMAFLDIGPSTKGHTLLIPKKHYRWTYDVDNFGEYFEVAKIIGLAAQETLNAEWIHLATYGVDVPHAHIHVVPRYKNDKHGATINPDIKEEFTKEEMEEITEKLKTQLLKK